MNDLVWLSALRRGIAYHEMVGRHTWCGRFIGETADGKPARGYLISESEAVEKYEAKSCRMCNGEKTAPRPMPSKDRGCGR